MIEIKWSWIKASDQHCANEQFSTAFPTLAQAKAFCLSKGASCSGVYDRNCDGEGPFIACKVGAFESSSAGSCVYEPSTWPFMRNTVRYKGNVYGTLSDYPTDGTVVRVVHQYASYRFCSTARLYV